MEVRRYPSLSLWGRRREGWLALGSCVHLLLAERFRLVCLEKVGLEDVLHGNTDALRSRSGLARKHHFCHLPLCVSTQVVDRKELYALVQLSTLSPQKAAVSYRCCQIASCLHSLILSTILQSDLSSTIPP